LIWPQTWSEKPWQTFTTPGGSMSRCSRWTPSSSTSRQRCLIASCAAFLCGFFPSRSGLCTSFFGSSALGGVGLTTWAEDSFLQWCQRELTASLPPQAPPAPGTPEAPRFDTPARLEVAFQQAGFVDIHVSMEEAEFVYPQEEDWWLSLWSHATRRRLERLEAPVLAQVKAAMLHKVQVLKQADGIHALFRAFCAVGTKPTP
jgi:hypothetical protein